MCKNVCIICTLFFATVATGKTIQVCENAKFTTIQSAVNAANDGDKVVVCDGIYQGSENKNIEITKSITIKSRSKKTDACIIDCENDGNAFSIQANGVAIQGFSIQNASDYAVQATRSSLHITKCNITYFIYNK